MEQTQSIEAKVAALEGVYGEWAPEIDPHGDPIFKVAFETAQGVKIFEVNSYEYYRLKVGMSGLLTWKGSQLISFGDYILASFPMGNQQ